MRYHKKAGNDIAMLSILGTIVFSSNEKYTRIRNTVPSLGRLSTISLLYSLISIPKIDRMFRGYSAKYGSR